MPKPTKAQRKVVAKAARQEAQRRADRARFMRRLYVVIGVVVVVGVAAFAALYKPKAKAPPDLGKLAAAAGCTAPVQQADEGRGHVAPPQRVNYKTNPPTSGAHYNVPGRAPANTGVWTSPVLDEAQVHNLEHGHTVVQYLPTIDPGVKTALESLARDPSFSDKVLVAPRPNMPQTQTVAITAWRELSICQKPTNAGAMTAYVRGWSDYFSTKSPEGFIAATPNP